MILKTLVKLLDNRAVKYDIIEHKTVYTALDSANTQRVKPDEIVKTLVLRIDNGFGLALISANKNLDKDKLKKIVNFANKKESGKVIKKVDFAKEDWMKKNIKGDLGATPPFGELFGCPTFIDTALLKQKTFYINSGDYKYSIKITRVNFEKVPRKALIQGSFSIVKKIKKQRLARKKSRKKIKKISGKKLTKKVGKRK